MVFADDLEPAMQLYMQITQKTHHTQLGSAQQALNSIQNMNGVAKAVSMMGDNKISHQ